MKCMSYLKHLQYKKEKGRQNICVHVCVYLVKGGGVQVILGFILIQCKFPSFFSHLCDLRSPNKKCTHEST